MLKLMIALIVFLAPSGEFVTHPNGTVIDKWDVPEWFHDECIDKMYECAFGDKDAVSKSSFEPLKSKEHVCMPYEGICWRVIFCRSDDPYGVAEDVPEACPDQPWGKG